MKLYLTNNELRLLVTGEKRGKQTKDLHNAWKTEKLGEVETKFIKTPFSQGYHHF